MDINTFFIALQGWIDGIRQKYSVNPYIFAFLYAACAIPFWIGLFKIIYYLKNKKIDKLAKWIIIYMLSIITPFVYIVLFGKNIPAWFYVALVVFILYLLWTGYNRIKNQSRVPSLKRIVLRKKKIPK